MNDLETLRRLNHDRWLEELDIYCPRCHQSQLWDSRTTWATEAWAWTRFGTAKSPNLALPRSTG